MNGLYPMVKKIKDSLCIQRTPNLVEVTNERDKILQNETSVVMGISIELTCCLNVRNN